MKEGTSAEANRVGANQMLTATPPPRNPKWKDASREIAFRDSYRQPEGNTCPGDTGQEKHHDVSIVSTDLTTGPKPTPLGFVSCFVAPDEV
ncbi:mCG147173 [Mus musculus]|nr:mCG147173 [Mus musculus]